MYILFCLSARSTPVFLFYLFLLTNLHFAHAMSEGHKERFWKRFGEIRKVGRTARQWTQEEYDRVLNLLKDDGVEANTARYKERHLDAIGLN